MNGPYGPYIKYKKKYNISIPKDVNPETLTKEQCLELIDRKFNKTDKKTKKNNQKKQQLRKQQLRKQQLRKRPLRKQQLKKQPLRKQQLRKRQKEE